MQSSGAAFMIDCSTIFWRMLRVTGWFAHPTDRLSQVIVIGGGARAGSLIAWGQAHPGVETSLGPDKGYSIEILFADSPPNPRELTLQFTTARGLLIEAPLSALIDERLATDATASLHQQFHALLQNIPNARVLDVGGRARSGRDRSRELPGSRAVVLDILDGPNVDVVGDAHRLSMLFERGSFDAFMSVAVFEHLAMPWKAAVELNRVLRLGGIGFALSHQSLGMHDMPWDFWRYSDQAWHCLFNKFTGFEVVGTALGAECYLIPFFWRPDKRDAERAVGFEISAVLVRKIAEAEVDWDVGSADLLDTHYPPGESAVDLSVPY